MSFSSKNTNTFKSESEKSGKSGKSWSGKSWSEKSWSGKSKGSSVDMKQSGPRAMTIGAMAGYVMPKKEYPENDTFEFVVHKHGDGTRTYDIASAYAKLIKTFLKNVEVTTDGPKLIMKGNRNDLKKVMSALIAAFKVRKANFGDTGKHKDAIIAGKKELIYHLEQDFAEEVEVKDVTSSPSEVKKNDKSFGKNSFAGLEIQEDNDDIKSTKDTTVAPETVEKHEVHAEPVKLSKKQRKAQTRMNYESLKFGPSLVLGGH